MDGEQAKIAFVAYSSREGVLADLIQEGVGRANAKQTKVRFEPWVFNDVPGNPLISPILTRIEESAFVVADITYLNLNVVYEVGYAIGSRKRAFLVRHATTKGDLDAAREAGIFDTLGYFEYSDADALAYRLIAHVAEEPLPFTTDLDRVAPVYVVEPPVKDEAATMMTSRLKKAAYRYRSFNPAEDPRLSAMDALRKVAASAGTLISLLPDQELDGRVHNVRSLFVCGLSHGMDKPTLILCPRDVQPPLDVRDEISSYQKTEDIVEHIGAFALDITAYLQRTEPPPVDAATFLQTLQLGDPTAENEMTTLWQYYLTTDQFSRALRGEVNLVIGRKGSGKTALFVQVRDRVRADKRNIVVDLKPEGYQLIKLKEDILAYLSEGSRQHLVTAFWEYLLLLEIAYKLLEKDRHTYRHNHVLHDMYVALDRTYRAGTFSVEGDFSERLLTLSQRIADEYRWRFAAQDGVKLTTQQVTELLYKHDIRQLRDQISAYLEHKESVWILFDNLDKGWSTAGVDAIDAIVLRCLIDAGRKLERDMRKSDHTCHCIVFIRNDVYEHLMQQSADYGKEMRAVLDWDDPDLLREMLRLRLVSQLDEGQTETPFDVIWRTVCVSHYRGEESSGYLIEHSLMRPRNVLKILSHARGFANNFRHQHITEEDVEKGLRAYSNDVLIELDRELTDVFPKAKDLLYHFVDSKKALSKDELEHLISGAGVDADDVPRVIDFLLYYGVIGLNDGAVEQFIYDVRYDLKILSIRATRVGDEGRYVINKAFWPALSIH